MLNDRLFCSSRRSGSDERAAGAGARSTRTRSFPTSALYRNIARLGAPPAAGGDRRLPGRGDRRRPGRAADPGAGSTTVPSAPGPRTCSPPAGASPPAKSPVLEHGLLTYAPPEGHGRRGPRAGPRFRRAFDTLPNADRNRDRVVTTDELRWYIDTTLPALAERLPRAAPACRRRWPGRLRWGRPPSSVRTRGSRAPTPRSR